MTIDRRLAVSVIFARSTTDFATTDNKAGCVSSTLTTTTTGMATTVTATLDDHFDFCNNAVPVAVLLVGRRRP
jgi:hypothetical protein